MSKWQGRGGVALVVVVECTGSGNECQQDTGGPLFGPSTAIAVGAGVTAIGNFLVRAGIELSRLVRIAIVVARHDEWIPALRMNNATLLDS